jgi:hypothetical protein
MTWGICRTDVRRNARVGDDLYFVAYGADRPPGDRYYLAARFQVAEKIDMADAIDRYPGRPNVILDVLPPGPSIEDRVVTYVADHRNLLRWTGVRTQIERSLREGDGWLRSHATDFVVDLTGRTYVHAYYDDHGDWRDKRLRGPYVVADEHASKILLDPIPYSDLATGCAALPSQESLRHMWGVQPRHNARTIPDAAGLFLAGHVEDARGRVPEA